MFKFISKFAFVMLLASPAIANNLFDKATEYTAMMQGRAEHGDRTGACYFAGRAMEALEVYADEQWFLSDSAKRKMSESKAKVEGFCLR